MARIQRVRLMRTGWDDDLLLEQERLVRTVRVLEEVFLELSRQFEIALVEERKATPILEILDPPVIRFAPKSPRLPILAGVGLLVGLLVGSIAAVLLDTPRLVRRGVVAPLRILLGHRG